MQRFVPAICAWRHCEVCSRVEGPFSCARLGSFGLQKFRSHSAFACAMQRRRPGGLNPTLLDGSPRNAAGEYAACMGLADGADAQAAMHADGVAWKERGNLGML